MTWSPITESASPPATWSIDARAAGRRKSGRRIRGTAAACASSRISWRIVASMFLITLGGANGSGPTWPLDPAVAVNICRPTGPRRLGYCRDMPEILESLAPQNLVHVHGLWRLHYLQSAHFARRAASADRQRARHVARRGAPAAGRSETHRAMAVPGCCVAARPLSARHGIRRGRGHSATGFSGTDCGRAVGRPRPCGKPFPAPVVGGGHRSPQGGAVSRPAASEQGAGTVAACLGACARTIRSLAPRGGRL